jgi:hypothetical protein
MDRTELRSRVSTASSLHQISSVMASVRAWLAEHPEDQEMRDAIAVLSRLEREHFAPTRR